MHIQAAGDNVTSTHLISPRRRTVVTAIAYVVIPLVTVVNLAITKLRPIISQKNMCRKKIKSKGSPVLDASVRVAAEPGHIT